MQKRIVIITETQGYLMLTLKEKFEESEYEVETLRANINTISRIDENISAILIYGDEVLVEKKQALVFVKDWAAEHEVPVFISGSLSELQEIESLVSESVVRQKFTRPLNINDMVESIDNFVQKFSTQSKKKILVVDIKDVFTQNY